MIEAHCPNERYEAGPAGAARVVSGAVSGPEKRRSPLAGDPTAPWASRSGFPPGLSRPEPRYDDRASGPAAQEGPPPMLTASTKRSTISERPARTHTPTHHRPDRAVAPAPRPACREGDEARREREDARATLPAHLLLLRAALADRTGRDQNTDPGPRTEDRTAAGCRRGAVHAAGTRQLTLSEWVSRTARIGTTADGRAKTH